MWMGAGLGLTREVQGCGMGGRTGSGGCLVGLGWGDVARAWSGV